MDGERGVERLARSQHGVVTRQQVFARGLSDGVIEHRLGTGRWRRMASGVYALAGTDATWRQKVLAACLSGGLGGVASHSSAAALWGLSGFVAGTVEVTVPRGRSHASRLAVVHQTRQLDPVDASTIDGIPVTRVARTLVDLAGCVDDARLEDAVDDAVIRRLVTLERLERRAAALRRPGRGGGQRLDSVLATWRGDDVPESVAEMRLVRRLLAAGVPSPELQYEVRGTGGHVVARLDVAWPRFQSGFELDGFRWHANPRGYQRDRRRHNQLKTLGWTVFQATPADLRGDGRELASLVLPFLTPDVARRRSA